MRSSQRIRQTLQRYQRKPVTQQGILGNEVGTISVPNRIDYVYVRVAGLGTIAVYNKRVPLILDLPVDVGYDPLEPKNFQVLNIHRYPQGGGRGLVDVATLLHGSTHGWGGIDPVYIEKRQIMPLRPTPMGGMNVYVTREVTYYDDKAVRVTGQQLDLSPYVPATGSWMVLLYKDTDEIIKVSTGGVLKDLFTLTLSDAPQVYPGTVPIALIRLYGGQTGIAEGYNDTDLIDVRQLFSPILTGTGGVGGGHVIQDEGVSRTQRTNLNFKGALVWAVDNAGANSTDIIISGTSGISTGTGHTIQDEGNTLPARGRLNFVGAGVIASDNAGNDATDVLITGGGSLPDHTHSTGTYTGGQFPLTNLQSTGAPHGFVATADGSGGIEWLTSSSAVVARTFIDGRLAVLTNVGGVFVAPAPLTLNSVFIHCDYTGITGSTIIDTNLNGTTIFTNQANRPTLAYNDADKVAKSGVPDFTTVLEGDVISWDIDQQATNAEGLTIEVFFGVTVPSGGGGITPPIEIPPSMLLNGYKLGVGTDNIALPLGTGADFDSVRLAFNAIYQYSGTIYVYYGGFDGSVWKMGAATAPVNGFTGKNFTKQAMSGSVTFGTFCTVLYDTDAEIWKGWYMNSAGHIGYATASDPLGPWTDQGEVLVDSQAWEDSTIGWPKVIREDASTYKMIYTGGTVTSNSRLGLATSSDGINWTKYASNPVLSPSGSDWMRLTTFQSSQITKINGVYYMYFTGKWRPGSVNDISRIGFAYSSDLISWMVDNDFPILWADRVWEGLNGYGGTEGENENPQYIQVGSVQYIYYSNWYGIPSTEGVVVVP